MNILEGLCRRSACVLIGPLMLMLLSCGTATGDDVVDVSHDDAETGTEVGTDSEPDLDTETDPPVDHDKDNDGSLDDADCNDVDPSVHPGATESCDDTKDRNCDGIPGNKTESDTCVYNGVYVGTIQVILSSGDYDGSAVNLMDPSTIATTTCSGTASLQVDVTAPQFGKIVGTLDCGSFDDADLWNEWKNFGNSKLTDCDLTDFTVGSDVDVNYDTSLPYFLGYGGASDDSCTSTFTVGGLSLEGDLSGASMSFGFGHGLASTSTAWHFDGSVQVGLVK